MLSNRTCPSRILSAVFKTTFRVPLSAFFRFISVFSLNSRKEESHELRKEAEAEIDYLNSAE